MECWIGGESETATITKPSVDDVVDGKSWRVGGRRRRSARDCGGWWGCWGVSGNAYARTVCCLMVARVLAKSRAAFSHFPDPVLFGLGFSVRSDTDSVLHTNTSLTTHSHTDTYTNTCTVKVRVRLFASNNAPIVPKNHHPTFRSQKDPMMIFKPTVRRS